MSNTESAQTTWRKLAESIGFSDEPTMWHQLYLIEERTIQELSKTLGYGTATIQRRMQLCGVERRTAGGARNASKTLIALTHLDQRYIRLHKVKEIAQTLGVSTHIVYNKMKEI